MINPDHPWVELLARRYADVLSSQESPDAELQQQLNTLQLASASLAQAELHRQYPDLCLQIAVLGPTQSGKSSLVNELLGNYSAAVSALAGFTVHTQGYAAGCAESEWLPVDELMRPLIRTPANSLDADNLDSYVLESSPLGADAIVSRAVVWDTPDFDSIEARTYSTAVFKTAALADIAILIVSKDKYGDKRVWDMLSLLHSLAKPLIVCINKLDDQDKEVIKAAFEARHQELFSCDIPTIVLLPFVQQVDAEQSSLFPDEYRKALENALSDAAQQIDRKEQTSACEQFIRDNEQRWLAPLLEEHNARSEWIAMIDQAAEHADQHYASTYLDNPDKYETFNRALAELLTLLEIPGVARVLARTRTVVTWPARRLLGAGRSVLQGQSIKEAATQSEVNQEAAVMQHVFDSTLINLQGQLLEQKQHPWWVALDEQYRLQLPRLRDSFTQQSELARTEFEPEIEAAAQALYAQLQEQPALLNTLRAARVSADAAGVALAVKSGGLAPADLILAPAMLSVTTLLTESALGKYLDSVKRNLIQQQQQHMREKVWQGLVARELRELSNSMKQAALFSHNIEPELQQRLILHSDTNNPST